MVDKNQAEAGRNSIYSVGLSVRHGVHTLRKVKTHFSTFKIITKRFGPTRLGYQRFALRKAAKLNAATARRSRNLSQAAAAQS